MGTRYQLRGRIVHCYVSQVGQLRRSAQCMALTVMVFSVLPVGLARSDVLASQPSPQAALPLASLGTCGVELRHPTTGQLIATIALRDSGRASFQIGDFLYVAHRTNFSVVNLRTQAVREVKSILSDWQWEQRMPLLNLHGSDGRSMTFDVTDPGDPVFVGLEFRPSLAPTAQKKREYHAGFLGGGGVLVGLGLVFGIAGPLLLKNAGATPERQFDPQGGIAGLALTVAAVPALVLPGCILIGLGVR